MDNTMNLWSVLAIFVGGGGGLVMGIKAMFDWMVKRQAVKAAAAKTSIESTNEERKDAIAAWMKMADRGEERIVRMETQIAELQVSMKTKDVTIMEQAVHIKAQAAQIKELEAQNMAQRDRNRELEGQIQELESQILEQTKLIKKLEQTLFKAGLDLPESQ